jgi:hypothetical protein
MCSEEMWCIFTSVPASMAEKWAGQERNSKRFGVVLKNFNAKICVVFRN